MLVGLQPCREPIVGKVAQQMGFPLRSTRAARLFPPVVGTKERRSAASSALLAPEVSATSRASWVFVQLVDRAAVGEIRHDNPGQSAKGGAEIQRLDERGGRVQQDPSRLLRPCALGDVELDAQGAASSPSAPRIGSAELRIVRRAPSKASISSSSSITGWPVASTRESRHSRGFPVRPAPVGRALKADRPPDPEAVHPESVEGPRSSR